MTAGVAGVVAEEGFVDLSICRAVVTCTRTHAPSLSFSLFRRFEPLGVVAIVGRIVRGLEIALAVSGGDSEMHAGIGIGKDAPGPSAGERLGEFSIYLGSR